MQLAQPVLTLLWSAVLLGEAVDALTVVALGVLGCVVLTQRTRERGHAPVGRPG